MAGRFAGAAAAASIAAGLAPTSVQAAGYRLEKNFMGQDFFSNFWFWDKPDLTHGHVDFVDEMTALENSMLDASAERAYMSADMWTRLEGGEKRKSVKIFSNDVYNAGLFVISLDHVPTGPGTWPAFWMTGGNTKETWPSWGEYDIIEGEHFDSQVSTTLHTDAGCWQDSQVAGRDFGGEWQAGSSKSQADDCFIQADGQWKNQGCSQKGPENSLGPAFNAQGGGTYAAQWRPLEGGGGYFRTWFWPNGTEPWDLKAGAPNPDNWGLPYSRYDLSPESCPQSHFKDMRLVFDLTFCGDMAGATYADKCPAEAAQMSCEDLISMHPEKLQEAYWSIRRLETYQWQEDLPFDEVPVPYGGPTEAESEVQSCARIGCYSSYVPGRCQCDPDCVTFGTCCFDASSVCNVFQAPADDYNSERSQGPDDYFTFLKRFSIPKELFARRLGWSASDGAAAAASAAAIVVAAASLVAVGSRLRRLGTGMVPGRPAHQRLLQVEGRPGAPEAELDITVETDRDQHEMQVLIIV